MKTASDWPCALERLPSTSIHIYDGPVVKLVGASEEPFAPYQPIIVDRFGEMIVEPTDFLRKKRQQSRRKSWKTAYQYARILGDILYVLATADGGLGIPYWRVTDDTLLRLRTVYTGPRMFKGKATGNRGIQNATWNTRLSLVLQFLLHCELKGWVRGLIGVPNDTRSFQVNLKRADPYPVHELELQEFEPDEVVIPQDESVEAVRFALDEMVSNRLVGRRNILIIGVMDENLRCSEAANLPVTAIPSAAHLRTLRAKAQATGTLKAVPIKVHGAKTDRERMVPFPLALAEKLRDFIDYDRRQFKPPRNETAIFVSFTTGKRLNPQSITNLFTKARQRALANASAEEAGEERLADIRRFHGHVLRHRRVTDGLADALEAGIDPVHAMQDTMKSAGMSFQTMVGYLHLSQERRASVLAKRGKVNQIRDDEVIKSLAALDLTRLDALSPRISRQKRRRR
jgi:site-specific recombinase XerD